MVYVLSHTTHITYIAPIIAKIQLFDKCGDLCCVNIVRAAQHRMALKRVIKRQGHYRPTSSAIIRESDVDLHGDNLGSDFSHPLLDSITEIDKNVFLVILQRIRAAFLL